MDMKISKAVAELSLPPFPYKKDFFGKKKATNSDRLVISAPHRI